MTIRIIIRTLLDWAKSFLANCSFLYLIVAYQMPQEATKTRRYLYPLATLLYLAYGDGYL